MTVQLSYVSQMTAVESLDTNSGFDSDKSVTHSLLNTSKTLNGTSSPAATQVGVSSLALAGGAGTLDLTALIGTNGAAVNGTGLRVQAAKFVNPATNANPITVSKSVSSGYDGFGASFSLTLSPGAEMTVLTADAGSDIGSGNKNLTLGGTGAQALNYEIVMG